MGVGTFGNLGSNIFAELFHLKANLKMFQKENLVTFQGKIRRQIKIFFAKKNFWKFFFRPPPKTAHQKICLLSHEKVAKKPPTRFYFIFHLPVSVRKVLQNFSEKSAVQQAFNKYWGLKVRGHFYGRSTAVQIGKNTYFLPFESPKTSIFVFESPKWGSGG